MTHGSPGWARVARDTLVDCRPGTIWWASWFAWWNISVINEHFNDYCPISLLNTSVKMLTKLLANKLHRVITKHIHNNQYGFIKDRNIQDCPTWSFEYMHLCKQTKKEMVILKLGFEKAIDKLEHNVIIDILRHKGFGPRWLMWIKMIMNSRTSSVLLNGVHAKLFHNKRQVRQGDPISQSCLFWLLTSFRSSSIRPRALVSSSYLYHKWVIKTSPSYSMQMTLF